MGFLIVVLFLWLVANYGGWGIFLFILGVVGYCCFKNSQTNHTGTYDANAIFDDNCKVISGEMSKAEYKRKMERGDYNR